MIYRDKILNKENIKPYEALDQKIFEERVMYLKIKYFYEV